ncbi:Hyaluronan mediated motility receptor [Nymphon striatum]|nr:Hyaluronan mediated motility receptor [Nymphon striatum]
MSFSKSAIKRFNEAIDCGPPVGTYDVTSDKEGCKGPVSFDRGDRFKMPKELSPIKSSFSLITPKKLFNTSQSSEGSEKRIPKKSAISFSFDNCKVSDLEKEIRNLLHERTQLLKDFTNKEQECKKIESKLQTANREKTYLNANVASLVKELKSLRKGNEVLKTQISTLESNGMKRNECLKELGQLKESLIEKKHDVEKLSEQLKEARTNYQNKVEECLAKEDDLVIAQTKLQNVHEKYNKANLVIDELEEKNSKLDAQVVDVCNELNEMGARMTELQVLNNKLETKQELYIGEMDSLQEHHATEVHDFLTKMSDLGYENSKLNSDYESLKIKIEFSIKEKELLEEDKACSILLQEYKNTLEERISLQKETITDLEQQKNKNKNLISNLKIDIQYLQNELKEKEQLIFENQAEIAEFVENIELLKENEKSLTENIKCFTDRCQELNEILEFERNTNHQQEGRLHSQIELMQCSLDSANEEIGEISANNVILISQLHSEKDLSNHKMRELKELELKFAQNSISLEIKEKDFHELWEVSQQKDKELEDMNKNKERCLEELDSLKNEFQLSQNVLLDLRAEIALIKSDCEEKEQRICALLNEKRDLISDFEKTAKNHEDICHNNKIQIETFLVEKDCQMTKFVELTESLANAEEEKLDLLTQLQEFELDKAEEEFSNLSKAKMDSDELHKEFEILREMVSDSDIKEELMMSEIESLTSTCQQLSTNEKNEISEVPLLQEKLEKIELEMQDKEISYLAELSAVECEATQKKMEFEQTIQNLKEENDRKTSEIEKWQMMYEQTLTFKKQVDLHSMEKKQTEKEKTEMELDYSKLKEQYAELLGHNNRKQKIKHIMKLKQENLDLKDDLNKCRELCAKQKWQLDNLGRQSGDMKRKSTLMGKENFPKPLCQAGNLRRNQLPKKSLSQSNLSQNCTSQNPRMSTNYGLL